MYLVRTEHMMATSQTLQPDGELDIAGADDVLNLEVLYTTLARAQPELQPWSAYRELGIAAITVSTRA